MSPLRKVSKKFIKMSEVYRVFSRQWDHMLDYSDDSLVNMFNHETHGAPITNPLCNGFYVGKQWMDVHLTMRQEDLVGGYLLKKELYEDPTLPQWWLDKVLK